MVARIGSQILVINFRNAFFENRFFARNLLAIARPVFRKMKEEKSGTIHSIYPDLAVILDQELSAILVSPPGSGKTTRLPTLLLEESYVSPQKRIVVVEPRRLAAKNAALYVSRLRGESAGLTVGYSVRFEKKISGQTCLEYLTEGILTARLREDPALSSIAVIVFDEFHERNLESDLALALALQCREIFRPDLRILVMSATLDPAPLQKLLGPSPLFQLEGSLFPVREIYRPMAENQRDMVSHALKSALAAMKSHPGDVLIFLPGKGEISRFLSLWQDSPEYTPDIVVLPLYGDLSFDRQEQALEKDPQGRRKMIAATNIAETSLTIEGVGIVVDSGQAKFLRYDPATALSRLVTGPIAMDSVRQRTGRAGRTAPGVVYRLWDPTHNAHLPEKTVPEIESADLASFVLSVASYGIEVEQLSLLTPPPVAHLKRARDLLQQMGALDEHSRITPAGSKMVKLPLHPRLARMVVAASEISKKSLRTACHLAALLSERDVFRVKGRAKQSPGNSNIALRISLIEDFLESNSGNVDFGSYHPDLEVDRDSLKRVARVSRELYSHQNLGGAELKGKTEETKQKDNGSWVEPGIAVLLYFAYPDRVGKKRGQGKATYLLSSGQGATLLDSEHWSHAEWIVAPVVDGAKGEHKIRLATELLLQELEHYASQDFHWHIEDRVEGGKPVRVECRTLGALEVQIRIVEADVFEKRQELLLAHIRKEGLQHFLERKETSSITLLHRMLLLKGAGYDFPPVAIEELEKTMEQWLFPFLDGIHELEQITPSLMHSALLSLLSFHQRKLLDQLAPVSIRVPSGSMIPLQYEKERVILAVRLQELFGVARTPAIAEGRIPVLLHLLSPAGRPIQVTSDLSGFWERTYPEVKKELKGRYPKHSWPDDPLHAEALRGTKRKKK